MALISRKVYICSWWICRALDAMGLGPPNKMNLCLNEQTVWLWPSRYLDQCSVGSQQLAAICKIRNKNTFNFFKSVISCSRSQDFMHFFSSTTHPDKKTVLHHIWLQLRINLEGLRRSHLAFKCYSRLNEALLVAFFYFIY